MEERNKYVTIIGKIDIVATDKTFWYLPDENKKYILHGSTILFTTSTGRVRRSQAIRIELI